jgi:hypothetical protein
MNENISKLETGVPVDLPADGNLFFKKTSL